MVWKYLWALSGLCLSLAGVAETYCVSAKKGDDAAAGTSWKEPLRSLSEALDRAKSGDVILLTVGSYYTGMSSFHINDSLTLIGGYTGEEGEGAEPAANTQLKTLLLPSSKVRCRVLVIGSHETPNIKVLIRNLTVTEGDATEDTFACRGGGIFNYADTELRDVEVLDNRASLSEEKEGWGGGIYNCLGRLTLTGNSVVSNNIASSSGVDAGWGGGIYNEEGQLVISGPVSVSNNIASWYGGIGLGGGIYNDEGTLLLDGQVKIYANVACKGGGTGGVLPPVMDGFGGFGGGILNHGANAETVVNDAIIFENYAIADGGNGFPAYGGGIHNENGGKLSVFFPSIVRDNVATAGTGNGHGGGISSVREGSRLTVTGTVERNTAVLNTSAPSHGYGGGIYCGETAESEASFIAFGRSAVIYNNVATTGIGKTFENGVYPNLTHTVILKSTPYVSLSYGSGCYEVPDGANFDVTASLHTGSFPTGKAAIIVNGQSSFIDKETTGPVAVPGLQNIKEDKVVEAGIFFRIFIKSTDFVETELLVGEYEVFAEEPFDFIFTVAEGHRDLIRVNVDGNMYEPESLGNGKYRYRYVVTSSTKESTYISPALPFTLSFLEYPANVSISFREKLLTNPAEPLSVAAGDNLSIKIDAGSLTSGQLKAYVNGQQANLFPTEVANNFELSFGTVKGNMEVRLVAVNLSTAPSPQFSGTQFTVSAQGLKIETPDIRTVSIYALTGELKVKRAIHGTAFIPLTKGIYIIETEGTVSRVIVR
jgi:hypothetical protein